MEYKGWTIETPTVSDGYTWQATKGDYTKHSKDYPSDFEHEALESAQKFVDWMVENDQDRRTMIVELIPFGEADICSDEEFWCLAFDELRGRNPSATVSWLATSIRAELLNKFTRLIDGQLEDYVNNLLKKHD